MVKIAKVKLSSLSLYSQSKPHKTPKKNKEGANDYEARTWHERLHVEDGQVVIPAMAFKNCISEAAKFLSLQIPGKGKSTYTKHFEAGVLVTLSPPLFHPQTKEPIVPPSEKGLLQAILSDKDEVSAEDENAIKGWTRPVNEVWGDWIFTPADGVPGSGKRVWKCYPMVDKWECEAVFNILDDVITEDVFRTVLAQAGQLIGIGRFRVRNRGTYGRFNIDSLEWTEV